ncbi:MAG: DUF1015 domain-containing protein [Chitinispirillaceae bacterium]|nr:DUF1015 domain-containing protein [Chitinispirillaceae bacterium]
MCDSPEIVLQRSYGANNIFFVKEEEGMAEVRPFKGFRFRLRRPDDLGRFIAPPYDMLDGAMIDDLYKKDDCNIVRITQNKPRHDDHTNADRHARAASVLSSWVEKGILQRDEEPSVYIYEQRFTDDRCLEKKEVVRTGVVVLVKLADFAEKIVLPHEATLSGPKQDRYELLDACRTHTEQVFGLLDDDGRFHAMVRGMVNDHPDGCFTDSDGVAHSLFRCSDRTSIEALIALAGGRTVLIADGHHRYETGLNFYRDHHRPEYAYIMITLVSTADPGLLIRPFHRLVRRAGRSVDMHAEIAEYFTLEDHGDADAKTIYRFIASEDRRELLFLDGAKGRLYGCTLNDNGEQFLSSTMPERSMLWKRLPVSMINVIVINTIMGLPLDGRVLHDVIDYVNNIPAGIERCMGNGDFHGGFFIRPATIATVGAVVAAGERMPQKSTNFYPKIYSGLVLYRMDPA